MKWNTQEGGVPSGTRPRKRSHASELRFRLERLTAGMTRGEGAWRWA